MVAPPAVAEAVVQDSRLALRQHVVGLGELAEVSLGVGRVGDVGVPVAREAVERAPDRLVVGVGGDAQHLVIVTLGGGHQP